MSKEFKAGYRVAVCISLGAIVGLLFGIAQTLQQILEKL